MATHFTGFVLCDFMLGVLLAVFALAVGATSLRYVDLLGTTKVSEVRVLLLSSSLQRFPLYSSGPLDCISSVISRYHCPEKLHKLPIIPSSLLRLQSSMIPEVVVVQP